MKKILTSIMLLWFIFYLYDNNEAKVDNILAVEKSKTRQIVKAIEAPKTKVIATVYHAVQEQTNEDPSHTADMTKLDLNNPYKHRIIAVSRDLLDEYPYGTSVVVGGVGNYNGQYTIHDTMNKRYKGRVDILINQGMPTNRWDGAHISKVNSNQGVYHSRGTYSGYGNHGGYDGTYTSAYADAMIVREVHNLAFGYDNNH